VLDQVLETLKNDNTIHGDVGPYLLNLILHMKMVIEEYRLDIRGDYDLARSDDPEDHDRHRVCEAALGLAARGLLSSHSDGSAIEWSTIWPMLMLGGGN
jgi:hypothetical protein